MIRCESVEDLLPLHATGDTTVEEALQVEEHTGGCGTCRGEMEFYAKLAGVARDELTQAPPVPEAVHLPAGARSGGSRRLAAAAALLAAGLALGTALGRWSAAEPVPAPSEPAAVLPAAMAEARSLPLSVFSPHARARLSRVARAEGPKAP
jgi:hypothetical protein